MDLSTTEPAVVNDIEQYKDWLDAMTAVPAADALTPLHGGAEEAADAAARLRKVQRTLGPWVQTQAIAGWGHPVETWCRHGLRAEGGRLGVVPLAFVKRERHYPSVLFEVPREDVATRAFNGRVGDTDCAKAQADELLVYLGYTLLPEV
jgi:hypothetical protein